MGRKKVKTSKRRRRQENQNLIQAFNSNSEFQQSPATTSSTPSDSDGQYSIKNPDLQQEVNQYINQLAIQYKNQKICQATFSAEKIKAIAYQYKEEVFDFISKIYMDCLNELKRVNGEEVIYSDLEDKENIITQVLFIQKFLYIKKILEDLTDLAQQFVEVNFLYQGYLNLNFGRNQQAFQQKKEYYIIQRANIGLQEVCSNYLQWILMHTISGQPTQLGSRALIQLMRFYLHSSSSSLQRYCTQRSKSSSKFQMHQSIIAAMKMEIDIQKYFNFEISQFLKIEQELNQIDSNNFQTQVESFYEQMNYSCSEDEEQYQITYESENQEEDIYENYNQSQSSMNESPAQYVQDFCQGMDIDQIVDFIQGDKSQNNQSSGKKSSKKKKKQQLCEELQMDEQDEELISFQTRLQQHYNINQQKIKPNIQQDFIKKLKDQIETRRKLQFQIQKI